MEMEYIRKLTASYMVLPQIEEPADWELKMIAHAQVQGILFGEGARQNEQCSLWYDISGMQSLDTLLDSTRISHEMLCMILNGIYVAVDGLEHILLQADELLLLPQSIFVDYRTERIRICYYPGNTQDITAAFGALMEYMLERLDHEDKAAVELAYGIYEKAVQGQCGLSVLKELLCIPYEKEEEAEAKYVNKPVENEPPKRDEEAGERQDTLPNGKQSHIPKGVVSWKSRCVKKLQQFFKRKSGVKERIKGRDKEETFVFEPESEETDIREMRPTVLLAEITKPLEGVLRYEGKGICKDLNISGISYVIGSGLDCDGYVPSKTVSRTHAKITRKEDIYFIEDLNSSNGTYVGGDMLSYKTKVSLQKNEVVIFADEKFRFI